MWRNWREVALVVKWAALICGELVLGLREAGDACWMQWRHSSDYLTSCSSTHMPLQARDRELIKKIHQPSPPKPSTLHTHPDRDSDCHAETRTPPDPPCSPQGLRGRCQTHWVLFNLISTTSPSKKRKNSPANHCPFPPRCLSGLNSCPAATAALAAAATPSDATFMASTRRSSEGLRRQKDDGRPDVDQS